MKKLSNKVRARIEEYKNKKVLTLREQIAALLLRSEKFLSESYSGPIEGGFLRYSREQEVFCQRWHIKTSWSGRDEDLAESVEPGPLAFYQNQSKHGAIANVGMNQESLAGGDPYGEAWALDLGKVTGNFIYIRIDPWTAKDDIDWRKIRKLKADCFGSDFREKSDTFARDLCWYDLLTRFQLDLQDIADIWYHTDDRLREDIRAIFKKGKAISRGRVNPENREDYNEDEYVRAPGTDRYGQPRFQDTIEGSIDRISAYILQIENYAINFHPSVNF
jgi:hypothetical protein